jgi:hypothetical protein
MTNKHRDIDFAEVAYSYTGPVQVDGPAPGSQELRITVECPACAGEVDTEVSRGLPYGSKGWLWWRPGEERPSGPVTMYCGCGYIHPKQPDTVTGTGCGAYWEVVLS